MDRPGSISRRRTADRRRGLVEANLDLAIRLARRFRDDRLSLEERHSAAAFGLVAAADAYRGPVGGFRRYAAAYAWGEMKAESRRLVGGGINLGERDVLVRDIPPDDEDAAVADPRLAVLAEAMRSIPTKQREVIRSLMRGETHARIARRLGVGRTTVERWRDVAIERLRELVA